MHWKGDPLKVLKPVLELAEAALTGFGLRGSKLSPSPSPSDQEV